MKEALLESEPEIIRLASLKARFLGNAELLDRVLSTFVETLDADLQSLEEAIRDDDSEAAAFLAHRIKGMAASVEARVLWKSASLAEESAKSKSLDKLSAALIQLRCDQETLAQVLRLEGCAAR